MTPTQRAAIELAILDLEHISAASGRVEFVERRIAALRAALAEPAPVQEPVAKAWDEGYRAGINDERMSEVNIGIAGFNSKIEPARNNPYRGNAAQQPAPPADVPMLTEDEVEAVQEGIAVDDFAHDLVRRTERLVRQKAGRQ